MLNQIALQGRLTKDIELKNAGNNTLCSFTVATERNNKEKTTDFIECVAWNGTAEFIGKYFRKGSPIIVVGSLQTREWQDKNGNRRINYEINCAHAYFTGGSAKAEEVKPQNVFYEEPEDEQGELPFD